ncbi:MAG: UvrD-helicase domain-containing protein [Saprospiraceae bacterium]
MAYLYLTKNYKSNEVKYSSKIQPHLNIIQSLEDPKPIFEQFGRHPLFKRKVDNLRILVQEVIFTLDHIDYRVYCVRGVYTRGDKYYSDNFNTADLAKKWLDSNPIAHEEHNVIKQWLIYELEKEKKSKELPELTDDLKRWIGISDIYLSNSTIYETQEWTESIKEKDIYDFKETICSSILDIQSGTNISLVWEKMGRNVYLAQGEYQTYILFEKMSFNGETPILILYKVFKGEQPSEENIENILKNYQYNSETSKDMLIRDAKRAYPDYILIEPQLWFRIQEDSIANLALSPEEEELLQSATFPLFINGQAGSGKSTMLFYLFAHFCSLSKDENQQPLFLTYNKRLLETAKKNVASILKNHPNYVEQQIDIKKVETFFHPFQDFILNNFISEKDKSRFSRDKYISFSKFKQCFSGDYPQKNLNCQLPNKHNYSPELIWHIIRTYIKGYDFESDFSVDEYAKLPKKLILRSA